MRAMLEDKTSRGFNRLPFQTPRPPRPDTAHGQACRQYPGLQCPRSACSLPAAEEVGGTAPVTMLVPGHDPARLWRCGYRRVPNPTTVIPAKAGIHIPRTLKLLLLRQGLWIPAFAEMTKKNAPPSCLTLRQAQDRLVPASTGRLWPSRGVDPDQRRDDEGNMPSTPPTQPLYISAKP